MRKCDEIGEELKLFNHSSKSTQLSSPLTDERWQENKIFRSI